MEVENMRLTKYNLIFNAGREVSLVKEKAVNLAGYDRLQLDFSKLATVVQMRRL